MAEPIRLNYTAIENASGELIFRPLLPVALAAPNRRIDTLALLDTGADVSVLPYRLGIQLGLNWQDYPAHVQLSGNLANYDTRTVLLVGTVNPFPPVSLLFIWTRGEFSMPILGNLTFFTQFNVCFFGAERAFEIRQRSDQNGS
jgi:hypothetical protein